MWYNTTDMKNVNIEEKKTNLVPCCDMKLQISRLRPTQI